MIGSVTERVVPRLGALSSDIRPPMESTLSANPVSPDPAVGSAPPRPLSAISSFSLLSTTRAWTRARSALACLTTLVSASAMMK